MKYPSRLPIFTFALCCVFCGLVELVSQFGVTGATGSMLIPASAATATATPIPSPTPKPSPSIISFDPPSPSVLPGSRVQVTARVLDDKGVEVAGTKITSADVDPAYKDYLSVSLDNTKQNSIISVIGLSGPATSARRPRVAPVVAKYTAPNPPIENVLNVQLGTSAPPPSPIPTDSPQVDVMWAVIPQKIVRDNFGLRVSELYYGIGVVIGNNSGYSLQLASVGFTVPNVTANLPNPPQFIPAANYQLTRGTIVREETIGLRALTLSALPALASVLNGVTPFFHAVNHKANFAQFVSLFSGPFNAGVPSVWPDTISGHLVRLDQQALRNDNQNVRTIIENNTQYASVTFFPRHFLDGYFERISGSPKPCNKQCQRNRDDPEQVMGALGNMVLIGEQVEFVNRIRLAGAAVTTSNQAFSISGNITECGVGMPNATVNLTGDPPFAARTTPTDNNGKYTFDKIPAGGNYQVGPTADANFTYPSAPTQYSFILNADASGMDFKTVLKFNAVKVTVLDSSSAEPVAGVSLTLSPGGAKGTTGKDGIYIFTVQSVSSPYSVAASLNGYDIPQPPSVTLSGGVCHVGEIKPRAQKR